MVLKPAAKTSTLKASTVLSNTAKPLAKRRIKYAPLTASSVFPMPIPMDVRAEPAVVKLTRNAPTKTAGATLVPKSRHAANEIPAGAHTAVALG